MFKKQADVLCLFRVRTVTSTEFKLESQASTLPRAGRVGKSLPLSSAGSAPSGSLSGSSNQQTDAAAEPPGKRRSAAHSYRMQTESSLAKVTASKESLTESSSKGGITKKESYTMVRFPSTPDIAADVQEVDSFAESVKNSERSGSVENASERQSVRMDGHFKADNISGIASVKSHADGDSHLTDANDRGLMPPPLSTSVPLSYQANFIAKAAKYRRTTMPESLARSRELLAGAIAKHHQLSDSSATDGDESPPSSSSVYTFSVSSKQTLDSSPLEPPERDIRKTQSQVSSVHSTDLSTHSKSNVMGIQAERSTDNVSPADTSVTSSPKLVKVSRSVSPVHPQSALNTSQRRLLPPDPRLSVSVTHDATEHSSASDTVSTVPQLSTESRMRLMESTQDTQSATACPLSSNSSGGIPQIQQGLGLQQDSGQRPIASRTETRLVLSSECDNTENQTLTTEKTTVDETEHLYTGRQVSADRPSQLDVSKSADHRRTVDSELIVTPGGQTRQQWEKPKPVDSLIIKSQSNSSASHSQTSACDSFVLADISSLSRNSVSSASGSCLTYDVAPVGSSVSDSVISYGSSVQLPTAAVDTDYLRQMLHIRSGVTKDSKASEDNQMSLVAQPSDMGQALSAMSSDK